MDAEPEVVHLLVRENLANDQCTDAELGRVVQLCLEANERPTNESIQADSELTKKMIIKWDNLEVHNGLVYRRLDSPKPSKPTMLQFLVPRCCVPEVLCLCHTGTVGGHYGVKTTMIINTRSLRKSEEYNTRKAHQRANLIHRCFISKNTDLLIRAFKTYVRPMLKYNSPVLSPSLKK